MDNPYQQRVFAHWDLVNRLAKKRFPQHQGEDSSPLAEEAALYVLNQLEANDWQRIRRYREESSFPAYLTLVTQRLLEDFWRQKYGRVRTPTWIRALGPLWERAYRKLCQERWPRAVVIESLQTSLEPDRDPLVLEEIVAAIHARVVECGALAADRVEQRMSDFADTAHIEAVMETAVSTASAETPLSAEQRSHLLKAIAMWFEASDSTAPMQPDSAALPTALHTLQTQLQFTAEERLLLRLVFQEGLSVTDAGRRLGFNANQTHGRLRRVLDRIKQTLRTVGLAETFADAMTEDES